MKILHLVKRELTATERAILEAHRSGNAVEVVDLRTSTEYGRVVDLIASSDKVISW